MSFRTAVVRHHAGKVKIFLELDETLHERGDASPHPVDVHHKKNGRAQPAGDLGRAPLVAYGIRPVIEPHDTLDQRSSASAEARSKRVQTGSLPAIQQIVTRPARGEGKVGGVVASSVPL